MSETRAVYVACAVQRPPEIVIRCEEPGCNLPHAMIRGNCVIIRSRHRGETHTIVLSRAYLEALFEQAA